MPNMWNVYIPTILSISRCVLNCKRFPTIPSVSSHCVGWLCMCFLCDVGTSCMNYFSISTSDITWVVFYVYVHIDMLREYTWVYRWSMLKSQPFPLEQKGMSVKSYKLKLFSSFFFSLSPDRILLKVYNKIEILNVIGWKIKEYWIFMFVKITSERIGCGIIPSWFGISIYYVLLGLYYAYNMNNLFSYFYLLQNLLYVFFSKKLNCII